MVLVQCPDCRKGFDLRETSCPDCGRNIRTSKPSVMLTRPAMQLHFGRLAYPLMVAMGIWLVVILLA